MTIEKMITLLSIDNYAISRVNRDRIVAVLKTGQAMRDAVEIRMMDTTGYGRFTPCAIVDGYELAPLMLDWDKATANSESNTKGDVCGELK